LAYYLLTNRRFTCIRTNMRLTLFVFVITVALSCGHGNSTVNGEKLKPVTIQLIDSLGNVSISLPVRYDTFFTWTSHSDCGKSCDKQKYRYQPKYLRITKEGGFIWLGEPKDSIERFTVSHSGYFPFYEGNEKYFMAMHQQLTYNQTNELFCPASIIFDTLERINGRLFSIIIASLYDTALHQTTKRVNAATMIKSNDINFTFELVTKEKGEWVTDFIPTAMECVKTIKIEKGI
jgi:hypothetical protein